jgi:Tfp pilus assembly protein PilN
MIEHIEINLLPAEYRVHLTRFYLQREILYPLLGLILVVLFLIGWTISLDTTISTAQRKIDNTVLEINKNKHILTEITQLEEQKMIVQEKIRALERIDVNREKWIRLLEVLCEKLPEVTWLDKIAERNGAPQILEVEGKTYSFSEVAQFMSLLTESEFVSSVDLVNIEQVSVVDKIFKFILVCTLNPDARLNSRGTFRSPQGQ